MKHLFLSTILMFTCSILFGQLIEVTYKAGGKLILNTNEIHHILVDGTGAMIYFEGRGREAVQETPFAIAQASLGGLLSFRQGGTSDTIAVGVKWVREVNSTGLIKTKNRRGLLSKRYSYADTYASIAAQVLQYESINIGDVADKASDVEIDGTFHFENTVGGNTYQFLSAVGGSTDSIMGVPYEGLLQTANYGDTTTVAFGIGGVNISPGPGFIPLSGFFLSNPTDPPVDPTFSWGVDYTGSGWRGDTRMMVKDAGSTVAEYEFGYDDIVFSLSDGLSSDTFTFANLAGKGTWDVNSKATTTGQEWDFGAHLDNGWNFRYLLGTGGKQGDIYIDSSKIQGIWTEPGMSTNTLNLSPSEASLESVDPSGYGTMLAGYTSSMTLKFTDATGNGQIRLLPGGNSTVNIMLTGVETYADDTAAGAAGLSAGEVYKTATGVLMIKL